MLLAVVHAAGGCGGYGDEPAATGIPTGPGTRIPGLFPAAALPSEYTRWRIRWQISVIITVVMFFVPCILLVHHILPTSAH